MARGRQGEAGSGSNEWSDVWVAVVENLDWSLGLCSPALGTEVVKNETWVTLYVLRHGVELEIQSGHLTPAQGLASELPGEQNPETQSEAGLRYVPPPPHSLPVLPERSLPWSAGPIGSIQPQRRVATLSQGGTFLVSHNVTLPDENTPNLIPERVRE